MENATGLQRTQMAVAAAGYFELVHPTDTLKAVGQFYASEEDGLLCATVIEASYSAADKWEDVASYLSAKEWKAIHAQMEPHSCWYRIWQCVLKAFSKICKCIQTDEQRAINALSKLLCNGPALIVQDCVREVFPFDLKPTIEAWRGAQRCDLPALLEYVKTIYKERQVSPEAIEKYFSTAQIETPATYFKAFYRFMKGKIQTLPIRQNYDGINLPKLIEKAQAYYQRIQDFADYKFDESQIIKKGLKACHRATTLKRRLLLLLNGAPRRGMKKPNEDIKKFFNLLQA
ncbi:MAG: hypothetical protein MRY21_08025 [Simkaniaceae bacterium]|nr:hypothetical protein [Simkaniaceae bacterium]